MNAFKTFFAKAVKSGPSKTMGIVGFILVFPLTVGIGLSLLGLPVMGFGWVNGSDDKASAAEAAPITVVDFTKTPAAGVMRATLNDLDKTWSASSTEVLSAGLPHPLGCIEPGPTLSNSKAYNASGQEAQVTLAAYPAGVGAEMFKRVKDQVASCKPSGTSIYTYARDGVGVESATTDASWSGNNIETTYFRRGDLIVFVATDKGRDSLARAKVVDDVVQKHLTPEICVDQQQGINAQFRNALFAGDKFTGLQKTNKLTSEKVEVPRRTEEQFQTNVPIVEVPSPDLKVKAVERPSDDFAYPLWPLLPKEVAVPTVPAAPADQKLEGEARVRIADPNGPGCGWAFLTTVEASFDKKAVEARNATIMRTTQEALDADGPRWQKEIQAYWSAYEAYLKAVEEYKTYADRVNEVRAAWDVIHAAWAKYYTDYANWEAYQAERQDFIDRQAAAKKTWEDQTAACAALPGRISKYNTDIERYRTVTYPKYESDLAAFNANRPALQAKYEEDLAAWRAADPETRGPQPTPPTPPKEPAEPQRPTLNHPCPPNKPGIIDEKVPESKTAPAKPADPRPADQR